MAVKSGRGWLTGGAPVEEGRGGGESSEMVLGQAVGGGTVRTVMGAGSGVGGGLGMLEKERLKV